MQTAAPYFSLPEIEDDMPLNEVDKAWIRETIRNANKVQEPGVLRRIKEWGGIALVVPFLILAVNQWTGYVEFRTSTNLKLTTIEGKLSNIEGQLARQQISSQSLLSPEDFKSNLPELNAAIDTAKSHNIETPTDVLDRLQQKMISTDEHASDYWPVAAALISYRSQNATSFDQDLLAPSLPNCVDSEPHPMMVTKVGPIGNPLEVTEAYYENCRFTLDSPKDDAFINMLIRTKYPTIVFKHCRIIYSGGSFVVISRIDEDNVPTIAMSGPGKGMTISFHGPTLQFSNCAFSFSAIPNIPENGKQMLKQFLAQSGPTFAFLPATHS
jgi:hypothetical protein